MVSSLPSEVLDLVEMTPLEDLLIALLREWFSVVPIQSLVRDSQTFPAVILRHVGDWGDWAGDHRFIDTGEIAIEAMCEGIEGDRDAALLSEAVRVALYGSINKVIDGKGHLVNVRMIESPRRAPDWATAVGPVQYADLPTGVWRYESLYQVAARKPSEIIL